MGVLTVTTAVDDFAVAGALSRSAVEARVAACGQVSGPMTSTYWWDGKVEQAQEWVVAFKTTAGRSQDLIAHLRREHPYHVPEIIVTPVVGGSPDYLAWVEAETTPR